MQATDTVIEGASKSAPVATPTILRRVTAMLYESFLLLSVIMLAIALYMLVTWNSQHPLAREGLKVYLFVVTGAYFIWCWVDSGHTLAMKTWRIKVVKLGHHKVPLKAAVLRFLLSWGWFAPAFVACWAFGLHGKGEIALAFLVGIVAWAMTALFDRDRQFLHDRLAGTRLISLPKAKRP